MNNWVSQISWEEEGEEDVGLRSAVVPRAGFGEDDSWRGIQEVSGKFKSLENQLSQRWTNEGATSNLSYSVLLWLFFFFSSA